jgi:hypothetical protein
MTKEEFLDGNNHWLKSLQEYMQFKLRTYYKPWNKEERIVLTVQELEDIISDAVWHTAKDIDPLLFI